MNITKKLKILLISNTNAEESEHYDVIQAEGHSVNVHALQDINLLETVGREKPNVLVLHILIPDKTLLAQLKMIMHESPCAIVMFTDHENSELKKNAIESGIAAYVVNGWRPERFISVIDTTIIRFNQLYSIQTELENTRRQLNDRKLVEKAKGIIMKQSAVDEEVAYKALRTKAMNQNLKLVDLARCVITASELMN